MPARLIFLSIFAVFAAACGHEIGDSCILSTDCDPNGQRICDGSQPDGYCTVIGCDYNTCPDEAVCVRFFVGDFTNKTCDAATEDLPNSDATDDCNPDELCTVANQCVPRSAEQRYCMKKCSAEGDCRDRYECRDEALMIEHGGETVLPPGERPTPDLQPFCATAPL